MLRNTLVCLIATGLSSLCLANPEGPASTGELLTRLQTAGPRALVSYCSQQVPELKMQLEAEYLRFSENITIAMEPIRKKMGQKLLEPAQGDLGELEELPKTMLEAVKQLPAENYCLWLLSSMQNTTPEKLKASIEAAYARYEKLAAQRQQSSGK
jgi:hypothetical protein